MKNLLKLKSRKKNVKKQGHNKIDINYITCFDDAALLRKCFGIFT